VFGILTCFLLLWFLLGEERNEDRHDKNADYESNTKIRIVIGQRFTPSPAWGND